MFQLLSSYFNTILQNFSRNLEIVQEFYNENTYLCTGFIVNYTFLYFLYYSYLYYRDKIPKDIENDLSKFKNLSEELSSRDTDNKEIINQLNILSETLSSENTKFLETVKEQESQKEILIKENNDYKFIIEKLREKLFYTEKNVGQLKSVIVNLDTILKNGNDKDASTYITNFLKPNKKRKLF